MNASYQYILGTESLFHKGIRAVSQTRMPLKSNPSRAGKEKDARQIETKATNSISIKKTLI